jgi:hypothetical protein
VIGCQPSLHGWFRIIQPNGQSLSNFGHNKSKAPYSCFSLLGVLRSFNFIQFQGVQCQAYNRICCRDVHCNMIVIVIVVVVGTLKECEDHLVKLTVLIFLFFVLMYT